MEVSDCDLSSLSGAGESIRQDQGCEEAVLRSLRFIHLHSIILSRNYRRFSANMLCKGGINHTIWLNKTLFYSRVISYFQ